MINIEKVEKGEFIKVLNSQGKPQKKIWEVDGYCRTNKAYMLTDVEDFCNEKALKKGKKVIIIEY